MLQANYFNNIWCHEANSLVEFDLAKNRTLDTSQERGQRYKHGQCCLLMEQQEQPGMWS